MNTGAEGKDTRKWETEWEKACLVPAPQCIRNAYKYRIQWAPFYQLANKPTMHVCHLYGATEDHSQPLHGPHACAPKPYTEAFYIRQKPEKSGNKFSFISTTIPANGNGAARQTHTHTHTQGASTLTTRTWTPCHGCGIEEAPE